MVSKVTFFLEYFKYLKNPISCLLFKFGIKKDIVVKVKNSNKTIKFHDVNSLDDLMVKLRNVDYISDEFVTFMVDLNSSNDIIPWAGANIFNFYRVDKDFTIFPYFEYFISGY